MLIVLTCGHLYIQQPKSNIFIPLEMWPPDEYKPAIHSLLAPVDLHQLLREISVSLSFHFHKHTQIQQKSVKGLRRNQINSRSDFP